MGRLWVPGWGVSVRRDALVAVCVGALVGVGLTPGVVPSARAVGISPVAAAAGMADVPVRDHVPAAPIAAPLPSVVPSVVPSAAGGRVVVAGDGRAAAVVGGIGVSARASSVPVAGLARGERAELAAAPVRVDTARAAGGGLSVSVAGVGASAAWQGEVSVSDPVLAAAGAGVADRVSVRDSRGGVVPARVNAGSGTVTFTAAAGVYALDPGVKSDKGDYSATAPATDASWSSGTASGSFTWGMGLSVPGTPGGLNPTLKLAYDSGSVDGRRSSSNNQPSWVGEGFTLAQGSIQRSYRACNDDPGLNKPDVKTPSSLTGDLCWVSDNATLTLGGKSTRLVKIDDSTWRLKDDDGSSVRRVVGGLGAGNGTYNGESWVLTDKAGTKYYFGITKRYEGDAANLASTVWAPVFGNNPGEPCYSGAYGTSWCQQATTWNLAYVVDVHGNSITYQYAQEMNKYGLNNAASTQSYVRGAYLASISYGQRAGTEATTTAAARVDFEVAERCIPGGAVTCDPGQLTLANQTAWPDVPFSQICTESCTKAQGAPAFFTRKRLVKVTANVFAGGAFKPVRSWALSQSFPALDTGYSSLWLNQIQETGLAGSSPVVLPPTVFSGQSLPNRVDGIDNAPGFYHYRVNSITTALGAVVNVSYNPAQCATGGPLPDRAHLDANTYRCYPDFYTPQGLLEPEIHFFHKYTVAQVSVSAGAGSAQQVTTYTYEGSPAWHYDDAVTEADKRRTWSSWRGYADVTTSVGAAGESNRLVTKARYYRGMHGDRTLTAGVTRTVSVSDSYGGSGSSEEFFTGQVRQKSVFNGAELVTSTVTVPWASPPRGSDQYSTARMSGIGADSTHTARPGREEMVADTVNTFDDEGRVVAVQSAATGTETVCTRTRYAANGTGPRDLPAQVTSHAQPCANTTAST